MILFYFDLIIIIGLLINKSEIDSYIYISHSAFINCSIIYLRRIILFVVSISSSLDLKSKDPPN